MNALNMQHMRDKVEQQFKPTRQLMQADLVPHGRLLAGTMDLIIAHYEEIFRIMEERDKKLCWYEFCLTPEIFYAMNIHPFLGEAHPSIMSTGTPEVCWQYVDIAEENGTPSDLCVLDKFLFGALLSKEMPRADFMVTASAPCDSSRIGYQMFEQVTDCPVYRLDAPADDSPEAHQYYAGEIRKLIGFLEEQTGTRFDVDRLREVCEESNRATAALLDLLELRRARPCPHPASVMFASYLTIPTGLGTPGLSRYLQFLRDDAAEMVRSGRGAVANEKHRVLWYYVQVTFDLELAQWLQDNFQAAIIADMLSTLFRDEPIDTTTLDSMLLGLARRGLEATMGRLRVHATRLTERFLRDYADFGADCVVFPATVGCKHVFAWLGLLREVCRERGIPICAFDLDFMDSRMRPVESIRATLEEFFTTVMA
jgi:benzoyl-CoA reductase subunit B